MTSDIIEELKAVLTHDPAGSEWTRQTTLSIIEAAEAMEAALECIGHGHSVAQDALAKMKALREGRV